MVDKETCIKDINKFIQSKSLNDAMVLLEHLCDIKELPNKDEAIKSLLSNPVILSSIISDVLKELEIEFKLTRLADQYNNPILVY